MKLLFEIIIGAAILAIVVALYCTFIVGGRFDKQVNNGNTKASDGSSSKKLLCPKCKTGKDSYELDKQSDSCPYINCLSNGFCQFYEPLKKPSKTGIFKKK